MSTDGNMVWAFGDGDYGKLGLGSSTAKPSPQLVEALSGLETKNVYCGTQFSVVLTKDGRVFTFGQGMLRYLQRIYILLYSKSALITLFSTCPL